MELNNESLLFSSGYQKAFILLVFAALVALEKYHMHRDNKQDIVRHSKRVNLQIFLFNDIVMNLLSVSSLLAIAESLSGFGLLNVTDSVPLKMIISFVLYDLMMYVSHWTRHKNLFLWKFHRVHHSDWDLNATTTFRLHIGDVLFTTICKAIFIIVFGVPTLLVAFNEIIVTSIVMLNHANISFRGERLLSKVFVVPSKHAVHHSSTWGEHESNFGFALSIWDKMFGTCKKVTPAYYGLPTIREPSFFETLFLNWKRNKK